MRVSRLLLALALAAGVLATPPQALVAREQAPPATAASTRLADHVVVISIDGFRPQMYLEAERGGESLPALRALWTAGSRAEGVEVAYPSMTYPSHTSLATGTRPVRHGITSNTKFDPLRGSSAWYYEHDAMKVPAIWDVVRQHGLTAAGASWPVTVGARMDVLFPESNQMPETGTWLDRARADSTPGLVDAVVADLGGFGPRDNLNAVQRDRFTTAVAERIIRMHRPNVLLIHLMETDSVQHAEGPGTPAAHAALTRVDAHIGRLVRATEEAGIRARTAFIVTGDHGFSRVHTLIQPNVILRDGGWLTTGSDGRVATFEAASHATAIRLARPGDTVLAAAIESRFRELAAGRYKGIFRVVGRTELDAMGTYPEAAFFIEPAEGYYVSDGVAGGEVLVGTTRRGAHGFLSTEPRMHTGFIAAGAGIRPGVPLPLLRQIDIAPTIARLLGLTMPSADGVPMVGLLQEAPPAPRL